MYKHIKRVLRLSGHKMFLKPYEHENISVMVTKAKIKRLIANNSFIYKVKEVHTDFSANQTVIIWKQ